VDAGHQASLFGQEFRERKEEEGTRAWFWFKINFKLKFESFLDGCRWCWQASMVEGKV
jgi:hypothetical protein